MDTVSSWLNVNELRSYPIDEHHPCGIPDKFLSDAQVFITKSWSNLATLANPVRTESGVRSKETWPYLRSAAVTAHMATLVIACPGCKLFCTKSLADLVPYEPVELVSENGDCCGWVSFGDFDRTKPFSWENSGTESSGLLDPRAVVVVPASSIGKISLPPFVDGVSGDVRIVGGSGVIESEDPEHPGTIVLSLDPGVADAYSDPDYASFEVLLPDVCSINNLKSENGSIVLAFTGEPLASDQVAALQQEIAASESNSDIDVLVCICRDSTTFPNGLQETFNVKVTPKQGISIWIRDYRIVYIMPDAGLQPRDMEFALGIPHAPDYASQGFVSLWPALVDLGEVPPSLETEFSSSNPAEFSRTVFRKLADSAGNAIEVSEVFIDIAYSLVAYPQAISFVRKPISLDSLCPEAGE